MHQPRNAQLKPTKLGRHVGDDRGQGGVLVAGEFVSGIIYAARLRDRGKLLEVISVSRKPINDVDDASLLIDDLPRVANTDSPDEPDISQEAEAFFRDFIRLRHPEGCPCGQLGLLNDQGTRPRSLVFPGFLAPLLLSSGIRRPSLLYTPVRTDRAARDIRRKKNEDIPDAAQRRRSGQIEDAQRTAASQDLLQQEADLTAGHGVLRATGFVAVSASDPDGLERVVASIEQAAIQASCETRRLWDQQAQAFSRAAVPLCPPL